MVDAGLHSHRRGPLASIVRLGAARALVGLSLWRDALSLGLIAAGLAGLAILAGYVHAWMPVLPHLLPLHYDSSGSVDLIGPRVDLYKMPCIGAVVLGTDMILAALVHRRESLAARMLLAAGALVELMLLVATINIVRLAFGD